MPCLRVAALLRRPGGGGPLGYVEAVLPCRGLYAVVGPNGSGKTLLLRGLAGACRRCLEGLVEVATPRLMLPAEPVAPPGLEVRGWLWVNGASEAAGLLPEWLPRARLGSLSRGWRRVAELAAALFSRARVVLVDEPFTGLDGARRRLAEDLLEAAAGERLVVAAVHPGAVPRGAVVAVELGAGGGGPGVSCV